MGKGMSLRWRFLVVTWAIGVFFAVAVSLAYYTAHRDHYLDGIDAKLTTGAQMARHYVGADFHDRIVDQDSLDPEAYRTIVAHYDAASADAGFQYLWSNLFLPDGRIVFTTATSPGKDVTRGEHASFFATHNDPASFEVLLKDQRPTYKTFSNEWGEGRMVLLPYRDSHGRLYVFGASMELEPIKQHLLVQLGWTLGLFILMFVVATLAALSLSRSMITPLRQLQRTTDAVAQGDFSTPPAFGGGREIEALNGSLNQMRDTIQNTLRRLEESEAHFRTLFFSLPELIWLKDPDGVYLACNRQFEKFFDKPEAEIVGRTDYDFMPVELAEFFRGHDRAAMVAARPTVNEEWITYADDGHRALLKTTKTPMYAADGTLIGVLGIGYDITEMHALSESLVSQNERNLALLHNASDGIHILDHAGTVLEASDAFCAMLGYARDEIIGMNVLQWDVDLRAEDMPRIMAERLRNPLRTQFVTRHRRQDGTIFDVEISSCPIALEGQMVLFNSSRDISERKLAEAALQDERKVRETLLESIPGISYAMDASGYFTFCNRNFEKVTGRSAEELRQCNALDLFEGDDRELVAERIRQTFVTGESAVEAVLVSRDGQHLPYFFTGRRIEMDGQPVLIGTGVDIGPLKAAQQALRQLNDELEERVRQNTADLQATYAKLRDTEFAMNTVGIGIHWVDFNSGRFIHVNRFAASLLGYSPEELLQLTVSDIDPGFPPAAFREIAERIREFGYLKFETEQITRGGELIPVEMTVYFHEDQDAGAPARLISFMLDITERKQAEQQLRAAKRAAEAAAVAKSAFLANMSHEIRTPLNGVIGLARIGLRENTGRRTGETSARILEAGQHLQGIIDDILDFSKVEAGKLSIEPIPMSPLAVTQEALAMVADRAAEKGLSLSFTPPADLPDRVMGDALRLRQILVNLLSNAIKFTASGSVSVSLSRVGGEIAFAVADTGIGLTEDQCDRLFQPFEQADGSTSRKFGGTGLGLAISQNLAGLMGGSITVESVFGKGSVFTLRLPMPETEAQASSVPHAELLPGQRLLGLRLLAAEDMEINRIVLEDLLVQEGADCTMVGDGAQAVDAVRNNPEGFDLVLMDVQMPVMDGRTATREIARIAPGLPVIALTAHALPEERQLSIDAGMVDYLTKPIDQLDLVKVVQAHAPARLALRNALPPQGLPPSPIMPANPEAPVLGRTEPLLPDSPELDLNAGLRSVLGRRERYRALLDKFGPQYAGQVTRIRAALQAGDTSEARRLALGLKGVAATLGAQAVAAAALAVEQALNLALRDQVPADDVEPLLAALNESILRLLQAIESTRNA